MDENTKHIKQELESETDPWDRAMLRQYLKHAQVDADECAYELAHPEKFGGES